ncbi:hypothetical protein MWU59_03940 [Flavobacteriaceae bacterium F08102]|nr:hypothetical protein [Flavobacteriaceae bacterium F08102]
MMNKEKELSMKAIIRISIFLIYFFYQGIIYAQSVGINTTITDPSAVLDIVSNKAGVLIPRMTSMEIADIVDPADGLLVYNTETKNVIVIIDGVSYDLYNPPSVGNYSKTILANGIVSTWLGIATNTPEEFFGTSYNRVKMDLTKASEIRIMTNISSFSISIFGRELILALEYSTDNGATWAKVNAANNGPVMLISSTGFHVSNWFTIDPDAKGDVLLRLVANSPGILALGASFGLTSIEAR